MKRLLPLRTDAQPTEGRESRIVNMVSDEATEILDALGSDTARAILNALHEEPAPPSELGTALDLSLQNVRYHLRKLENADLIEPVDIWYSAKGNEMTVYAPTDAAVLLFSGPESNKTKQQLRRMLTRLVGSIGLLAVGSYAVEKGLNALDVQLIRIQNDSPQPGVEPNLATELFTHLADWLTGALTPGLLVFLGGLAVLLILSAWWYYSTAAQS